MGAQAILFIDGTPLILNRRMQCQFATCVRLKQKGILNGPYESVDMPRSKIKAHKMGKASDSILAS